MASSEWRMVDAKTPQQEDRLMNEMDVTRVLIIDDEPLIRRALADYLTECGFETVTAADGAEGLAQVRAEQFHVVLVDLRMPHVDGLEVIATLKAEQPELPLVVVSGTGVLNDVIEAMRRGAWDYITKPVQDMDEIMVVVERVLEKARLRAERDRYQSELEQLNRSLEDEVARQTRDLRTQNRELVALNRVSYAISDPLDLDTMLNRAIAAAVAAVEADGGAVRLLNPATSQLVIAAARGLPASYFKSAQNIPLGEGIIGQVAQSGHPRPGHNLADDPWLSSLSRRDTLQSTAEGFRSYLCVPLRTGEEIVGTLGVLSRAKRDFAAREVELLAIIGNQIGVAVTRAQYAADLERTNAQLERANTELRHLDTLREQFIQNVAHELRTPLALVRGHVEMLAQGDLDPEEQQMALNVASRRVQTLVELVESITVLQDLGSQSLRIEPVAPAELLQTAMRMVWQQATSSSIKLRSVCPPDLSPFPGDFTRLTQTLHQLLGNACKFSPEGSTVTVTARTTPAGDGMLISVADQGIGIPPEEHTRIFERFYQVDGSTTRRYGGTGLGLAIVKEIVEAHGGTIDINSDGIPGRGSTFTVILPISEG
jgi:signal transduction histidine kinase/DNA-binding response OmpR family regulator